MLFKLSLVILVSGLQKADFAGYQRTLQINKNVEDKFTEEAIFNTISAETISRCAVECHVTASCVSIGYVKQTNTCHMYSKAVIALDPSLFEDSVLGISYYGPTCRNDFQYVEEFSTCIKEYVEKMAYEDARITCEHNGAGLLIVRTKQQSDYIYNKVELHHHYWIGGQKQGGDWYWSDGTPIDSSNGGQLWLPGRPGSDACLQTDYRTGSNVTGIEDENCSIERRFFCQYA